MQAGSLELTLAWDGTQIVAAEVNSTRPPLARALRGLPVARVLEVVPRLALSLDPCVVHTWKVDHA